MGGTLETTSLETGPGPVRPPTSFERLRIVSDHCKGCGLCVEACPPHVLALDPTRVNVLGYNAVALSDPDGCTSCALCARVCPDAVFTVLAPPREVAA